MPGITVRRYCRCGGTLSARSTPSSAAEQVAALFDQFHTRDECGPATPAQATAARRRDEAAYKGAGRGG